eukprot:TRINITY_DN4321_c0_g1_i1.p1 TRINITY_DN4321_c0_g1~~TRINITY_DN4321_c0_g1_i1.p1  ORF type:complete len:107 (+),score=32.05 TRINITY_DN4321_c0_g1_i1:31-351(+)
MNSSGAFRRTLRLFVGANVPNQQQRKAIQSMDIVRKRLEETKRVKEERKDDGVIRDRLVLEAYKELEEERRAEELKMSVDTYRSMTKKQNRIEADKEKHRYGYDRR